MQAGYTNGVLKLELSKKAEAQPRQIKINVESAQSAEASKKIEEPELAGVR